MTALTPLALNTWISAASAARPAKAITRAEMIATPAASAAERANRRTTMLLPSPTLRDREGSPLSRNAGEGRGNSPRLPPPQAGEGWGGGYSDHGKRET